MLDTILHIAIGAAVLFLIIAIDYHNRLSSKSEEVLTSLVSSMGYRHGMSDALNGTTSSLKPDQVIPKFSHYYRKS